MVASTSSSAGERVGRGRRRWLLIGAALIFTVVLVALVLVDLSMADDAVLVTVDKPQSLPGPAALSPEQVSLLAERGNPDGFTIYFFSDDGQTARLETWSYHSSGSEVSFHNGALIDETRTKDDTAVGLPAPFKPDQFWAFMSLEETVAAAGLDEYAEVRIESEVVDGGTVHIAEQLMFGLKDGKLLYVEAVALGTVE
jgi:hypothetical protein